MGIRSAGDIRTWEEDLKLDDEIEGQFYWGDFSREDALKALEENSITVYSSYPIKNRSNHNSDSTTPIVARYDMDASVNSIAQNDKIVNNREIQKGNLVRIKNRSNHNSDSTTPIVAQYDMDASDNSISQKSNSVNRK